MKTLRIQQLSRLAVVAMCALMLASVCGCFTIQNENARIAFSPNSYSYDDSAITDSGCQFIATFYSNTSTVPFNDINDIVDAYISLGEEQIEIEISQISYISDNSIAEIDGEDIYVGKVICTIYQLSSGYYDDCKLTLNINSGESLTYPIGDIAYNAIQSNCPQGFSASLIEGITCVRDGEVVVSGVILMINAPEETTITEIDFGIRTLGLDAASIAVFSESEFNSVFRILEEDRLLDCILPKVYQQTVTNPVSNECNISIPAGTSYIYLPFAMLSSEQPQPQRLYAHITIVVNGNEYDLWANSFAINSSSFLADAAIAKLLGLSYE